MVCWQTMISISQALKAFIGKGFQCMPRAKIYPFFITSVIYAGIVYLWECFQVELREMGLSDFPYTNIVATIMHNIN